jgi:sugar lactone lactonase YvrE
MNAQAPNRNPDVPAAQAVPRLPHLRPSKFLRIPVFDFRILAPVCLLLLFSAGCAGTGSRTPPAPKVVWPPPPNPPRIALERVLRSPADLGVKPSVFQRVGQWLTGNPAGGDAFARPFGLALDEAANLCLTDTAAHRVGFFDARAVRWQSWDKIGGVALVAPVSVAKSGEVLYVADSGSGEVVAFDLLGKVQFRQREPLSRPVSVMVAGGRLWVADAQQHAIFVFNRKGGLEFQFGKRGTGPGEFNYPTHLAADAAGRIYVTDAMNCRVQVFDDSGKFLRQFGSVGDTPGHFSRPKGVAVSPAGHIYVADALFDNIQIFNEEGRLLLPVGQGGAGPGEFCQPAGLAIAPDGHIFVADSLNGRIQVLRYLGHDEKK